MTNTADSDPGPGREPGATEALPESSPETLPVSSGETVNNAPEKNAPEKTVGKVGAIVTRIRSSPLLLGGLVAIIILAAPKAQRVGLPNSHYLIHQPMSGTRGVATEIEIHAKEIEKLRAKINRLIAEETGQQMEKVEKDTDRDYWMNAEEAVSYGLISRVIKTRDEL